MAHALNLIVAGIVIKCSNVLQIGLCVKRESKFCTASKSGISKQG